MQVSEQHVSLQRLIKLKKHDIRDSRLQTKSGHLLKVKANGAEDELVRRKPIRDHVCVIYDVTAEQESANNRIDKIHSLAERDDHADNTSHN